MNKNLKVGAIILVAAVVLAGVAYVITRNNKITTASGLQYEDVKVGDGASPKMGETVRVHYVGRLVNENGKEFNNSHNGQPIEFKLDEVVKGWQEGLQSMKVGGTRRLWIPSKLAYGPGGRPPSIPPNSNLYFEIELLGIK
jgi:FKBP-type peptidyl-prolyl cis-trans isomerase